MFHIETPNKTFAGSRHDLDFVNGVAHTDNADIAELCHQSGYIVSHEPPIGDPTTEEPPQVEEIKPPAKPKRQTP